VTEGFGRGRIACDNLPRPIVDDTFERTTGAGLAQSPFRAIGEGGLNFRDQSSRTSSFALRIPLKN
jgi:hypothetical protein